MSAPRHVSVMKKEAVDALAPRDGEAYADATFGAGGYAREILSRAVCRIIAFDRDPTAIAAARSWASSFAGRLALVERPFDEMEEGLADSGEDGVDGAVFDLGVSSMQLDEAERGFSFRFDGPLSMRMDGARPDARDVVNAGEIDDLAAIFRAYGEEKRAGRIARAIVREREVAPIETTARLAEIVAKAAPAKPTDRIHPATRVFQALRIFVNDELGQLARGLVAAERVLRPDGRLVVVTFHSLEDRIVKRYLADRAGETAGPSRHAPPAAAKSRTFRLVGGKPLEAQGDEVDANPRARSAKLRAAIRLDAPARDDVAAFAPEPLVLSPALREWR